jgi:hypothetical protein
LEENNVVFRTGSRGPAERFVETTRSGEVGNAESDQVDALLHGKTSYSVTRS